MNYSSPETEKKSCQKGRSIMGKAQDAKKETKKQPLKSAKEKKLEKQQKKNAK